VPAQVHQTMSQGTEGMVLAEGGSSEHQKAIVSMARQSHAHARQRVVFANVSRMMARQNWHAADGDSA